MKNFIFQAALLRLRSVCPETVRLYAVERDRVRVSCLIRPGTVMVAAKSGPYRGLSQTGIVFLYYSISMGCTSAMLSRFLCLTHNNAPKKKSRMSSSHTPTTNRSTLRLECQPSDRVLRLNRKAFMIKLAIPTENWNWLKTARRGRA